MAYLLLIANVLMFVIMGAGTGSFDWSAQTLLNWGANLGEYSLHGQWRRLITASYLHGGFQHIVGNMVLLLIVGTLVSRKTGEIGFLVVYSICGVAAQMLSAAGHPEIVSVGASGAIAGIMGVACILATSDRCPEIDGKWLTQTLVLNALYSFAPNVDWLAHLGGFLAGLACGVALLIIPGAIAAPYAAE
jgi:rhomboid protease GluP